MKKKFLQGLLTMGMALAVTVGSSLIETKAAGISQSNITVDYANQKIKVTNNTDAKISAAVTTVKTNRNNESTVKLAAPVIYDADGKDVSIDISSLAVTKDNYISIWGNVNTDPVLIKLPKVSIKPRAIVDNEKKVTIVDVSKDRNSTAPAAGVFEYCTANGIWSNFENGKDSFAEYAYLGSSLRFRLKASESKAVGSNAVDILKDNKENEIKVYAAEGNFAGSELKAKISKWANGPKATINYLKRTIKFPRSTTPVQYRFTSANATTVGTWKTPSEAGKEIPFSNLEGVSANGTLDIRIPETKESDKITKAASLVTEYKLSNFSETVSVTITDTTSGSALNAKVVKDNSTLVECKEIKKKSSKDVTLVFDNKTNDYYEIIAAAEKKEPEDSTTSGIKKITPNKDTVSITVKKDTYIYIRKAGNAKEQTFATPYVYMGTAPMPAS